MSPLTVVVNEDAGLAGLNLRRVPHIAPNTVIKQLPPGTILQVAEPEATARPKVGQPGQWIQVRDPAGSQGYVYAQYVQLVQSVPLGTQLVVNPDLETFLAGGLALRDAPQTGAGSPASGPARSSTGSNRRSDPGQAGPRRTMVECARPARPPGLRGGLAGCAARDEVPPEVVARRSSSLSPDARLFDAPVTGQPVFLARHGRHTAATWPSLATGRPSWAERDQFIRVRSYAFKDGFVQASLLAVPGSVDRRVAVVDAALPYGECAWLYGLHDPYDRDLFAGSGKTGWVLFTERVVSGTGNPNYRAWSETYYLWRHRPVEQRLRRHRHHPRALGVRPFRRAVRAVGAEARPAATSGSSATR